MLVCKNLMHDKAPAATAARVRVHVLHSLHPSVHPWARHGPAKQKNKTYKERERERERERVAMTVREREVGRRSQRWPPIERERERVAMTVGEREMGRRSQRWPPISSSLSDSHMRRTGTEKEWGHTCQVLRAPVV
ncbi:unnamed protein product [Musa banksii]